MSSDKVGRKGWIEWDVGCGTDESPSVLFDRDPTKAEMPDGSKVIILTTEQLDKLVGEAEARGAAHSTGLSVTQEEFDMMNHCCGGKPFGSGYRNYYCASEVNQCQWEKLKARYLAENEEGKPHIFRLTRLGLAAVWMRQKRIEPVDTQAYTDTIRRDALEEARDYLREAAEHISPEGGGNLLIQAGDAIRALVKG